MRHTNASLRCLRFILVALAAVTCGCGVRDQGDADSGSGDGDGDGHPECEQPSISEDEGWAMAVYSVYFSEGVPGVPLEADVRGVGECTITGLSDGVAPDEETELLLVHMECTTVDDLTDNMTFEDPVTLAISTAVGTPKIAALPVGSAVTIAYAITGVYDEFEEDPSRNYGRVEHDGEVLAVWGSGGQSDIQPAIPPPVELGTLPYDLLPVEPWYPFHATSEVDVCPTEVVLEECWSIERLGYRFDDGSLVVDRRTEIVSAEGLDYSVVMLAHRLQWLVGYDGCPSTGETNHSSYELRAVAI